MTDSDFYAPASPWVLFLKQGGIIPAFIACIWSVTLVLTVVLFFQERRLATHMTPTTATVIDNVVTENRNTGTPSFTYSLDLRFTTQEGRNMRLRHPVDQNVFKVATPGSVLQIWYHDQDPSIANLFYQKTSRGMKFLFWSNLTVLFCTLVLLARPILKTRGALRVRKDGDWRTAKVVGTKSSWPPKEDGPMARLIWQDFEGNEGTSFRHPAKELESFPKGRRIEIARQGKDSWWIKDIGQEF
ncbi:DUF3592 domain-containing protein [uncultured Pelagimonas sp.]|uniref:DUF3592 domain-containing protein n=1 Tax=uncultured Pelagimonas sp. TaxID=1618102 RepID=UPI002609F7BC|nr:DUF3592 domain-containing protein [uncultured Pelagimonas sp.]